MSLDFNALATKVSHIVMRITSYFRSPVDILYVYGGGTVYTDATITAAINAVGSTMTSIKLAPGTWTISNNITIPTNIYIDISTATLSIASGKTFTVNGLMDNTLNQKFSGAGTVSFGNGSVKGVYPQWWGAKGDGVTDNTEFFTKAKNACTSSNIVFFIPAGIYKGSIGLNSTDDYLTICGEDWENTILEAKDNTTATISIPYGCHYVTIENIFIKNTSLANNGAHYGIHSQGDGIGNGASYLTLRKIKVEKYNINIKLDEFNGHTLNNVYAIAAVASTTPPTGANIYAGHPTTHCVGLWMDDVHAFGGKYGYYMETIEGTAFVNCESLLATENGFLHKTDSSGVTGMQMTNCQFDSAGNGALSLYKVFNGNFTNVWVSSSNTAAGPGTYGLYIHSCDLNTFVGLQTYGNTTNGVHIATNCNKNSFIGCHSISNGTNGYLIDDGSCDNIFSGCTAWNNTSKGFNFADLSSAPNIITDCVDVGNGSATTIQAKDIRRGGAGNAGRNITYTFFKSNLADSAGSGYVTALPNTDLQGYTIPRNGSVISISVLLNDTCSAGELNIRPTVNGTAKDALKVLIDVNNPQKISLEVPIGAIPVSANDLIGAWYDTNAAWNTTGAANTVDFNVVIEVTTQ